MRGLGGIGVSIHNYTGVYARNVSQYAVHCCSTLEERAHRLFMTKGVVLESLDPSQFAKSRNPHKRDTERQVEVGLLEAQVYRYAELLGVSECERVCGVRV